MEEIAQMLGMGFVGIIMICLGWTLSEFLIEWIKRPSKRNRKTN